jgi:hypothetical protein
MGPLMTVTLVQALATCLLGVFVGSLVAEGALLVPYWQTLDADQFHELHHFFGPRLYRFYAPLTIGATSVAVLAGGLQAVSRKEGWMLSSAAAVCALAMIAVYFLFFSAANAAFAAGTTSPDELPVALRSWARWHWFRVAMGLVALMLSIAALV